MQPLSGFMVLAIGAMTVTAAAVNHMVFAALGALIDRSAQYFQGSTARSL
jgi:hypothetical protein